MVNVMESRDTPTAGKNNLVPISVSIVHYRLCTFSYMYIVTLLALDSLSLAERESI